MPLRTRQQDHSPVHRPTVIPSTTIYLLTLTLAHDDPVKPLPAPDILGNFMGVLNLPLGLVLIFASPLVLLAEYNPSGSKLFGERQS